jgi:hypothetical protein
MKEELSSFHPSSLIPSEAGAALAPGGPIISPRSQQGKEKTAARRFSVR